MIQYLLTDAQILEVLKDSLAKQIATLLSVHRWYLSDASKAVHESSLDEVANHMRDFEKAIDELQNSTEKQLKNLAESSQSMIQLVLLLPVHFRKYRTHNKDRSST